VVFPGGGQIYGPDLAMRRLSEGPQRDRQERPTGSGGAHRTASADPQLRIEVDRKRAAYGITPGALN
jgi:hypothetical protein